MTTTARVAQASFPASFLGVVVLACCLNVCCPNVDAIEPGLIQQKKVGENTFAVRLLFEDQFADLSNWVVESDGQVDVHDGQLIWDCVRRKTAMGTIWCRQPFSGPTIVEYDAVAEDGQNNLNFIAYATHPPDGLLETTKERTGKYQEYHQFPNNIITYLSPDKVPDRADGLASRWRVRFRRNPGFNLLSETYVTRKAAASEKQRLTYVFDSGGTMSLFVDGNLAHRFVDPGPAMRQGHHGFRTWKSLVRYSNFKVYQIETGQRPSSKDSSSQPSRAVR